MTLNIRTYLYLPRPIKRAKTRNLSDYEKRSSETVSDDLRVIWI
nr:MAG TPA: hypothetical protein [Caudoviricetes sp.]